ncbi:rna-directed dna polymerase from mobile element jockey-like [Willisornis vidua]|uniref:Rna-directed dna polymerase from mobile element jockey-like n=1 Tax=Willisornis vidua TaxID=1566151 RepID=A0ABQ9D3J1_9PASS|nr:rna-directed dna polymerase from mobile element jockey-like [Willisornis vidua]
MVTVAKTANNFHFTHKIHSADKQQIKVSLHQMESWAYTNLMKFNKAKCKALHLDQGDPKQKYRPGGEWIESSPEEKDLGVLAEEQLNMSWQCALVAQKPVFWIASKRSMSYRPCYDSMILNLSRNLIAALQ